MTTDLFSHHQTPSHRTNAPKKARLTRDRMCGNLTTTTGTVLKRLGIAALLLFAITVALLAEADGSWLTESRRIGDTPSLEDVLAHERGTDTLLLIKYEYRHANLVDHSYNIKHCSLFLLFYSMDCSASQTTCNRWLH